MSLERRGTRVVYTRSRRVGGRIVREYVGSGQFGEFMAELDVLAREERRLARAVEQAEREEVEALDRRLDELNKAIETLARGSLLAAGYHLHKRGSWRKRRGNKKIKTAPHQTNSDLGREA